MATEPRDHGGVERKIAATTGELVYRVSNATTNADTFTVAGDGGVAAAYIGTTGNILAGGNIGATGAVAGAAANITGNLVAASATFSGLKLFTYNAAVADDATVELPAITNFGSLFVTAGTTNAASFQGYVGPTGTAYQAYAPPATVVMNADTDTKLCIGTAAAQEPLLIKNRLGSEQVIHIVLWYD
jgi:hypothetical protein